MKKALAILDELPPSSTQSVSLGAIQFGLGKAIHRLADDPRTTRGGRLKQLLDARLWYDRSLPALVEAQKGGSLQGQHLRMVDQARAGIRNCDEKLVNAGRRAPQVP